MDVINEEIKEVLTNNNSTRTTKRNSGSYK